MSKRRAFRPGISEPNGVTVQAISGTPIDFSTAAATSGPMPFASPFSSM